MNEYTIAIGLGNLGMLQWLKNSNKEWGIDTLKKAISTNDCAIIEWCVQNGCPCNVSLRDLFQSNKEVVLYCLSKFIIWNPVEAATLINRRDCKRMLRICQENNYYIYSLSSDFCRLYTLYTGEIKTITSFFDLKESVGDWSLFLKYVVSSFTMFNIYRRVAVVCNEIFLMAIAEKKYDIVEYIILKEEMEISKEIIDYALSVSIRLLTYFEGYMNIMSENALRHLTSFQATSTVYNMNHLRLSYRLILS